MKNVPSSHELVGTRDVMESTLVKALPRSIRKPNEGPSFNSLINEPGDIKSPMAIARWEAILKAVQAWSSAFDPAIYPIFHEVHRTLQRRGVRFPPVDKEENAPVFMKPATPVRPAGAGAAAAGAASGSASSGGHLGPQPSAPPQMSPGGPRGGGAGGSAGATSDMKTSMETVRIFREMLDNSEEGYPLAEDELIQQLYNTCRSNAGILSTRLTNAANSNSADTDENTMMQLISTHEAILDTLKYYEGIVSGTMKPRGSSGRAAASASPGGFDEEKEEKEVHRRHHAAPAAESSGRSAVAAPAAAPAAVPAPVHARRKSDLPPMLAEFDMLGISPEPVPVQQQQQPPQQVQPAKAQAADSFDMAASFPQPMNPVVLAAPPAASPAKRSSASGALPLLAPPPTSATRHRKRGSTDMGSPAAGAPAAASATTPPKPAASQHQSAPASTPTDNLLNLDFLMANNNPDGAESQSAPVNDLFASQPQSSAVPFHAAQTPPQQPQQPVASIFDVLASEPGAASAAGAPPAAAAANPFESFDADPFGDNANKNAFNF